MEQVDTNDYRSLNEETCNQIIETIQSFKGNYTPEEMDRIVLPNIAQWLYDVYVDLESTCLIISTITNINRLEEQIEQIYKETIAPLPSKTMLMEFLQKEEFDSLYRAIEPKKREGTIRGEIDDTTSLVVNFKTKQIYQAKESMKKGQSAKMTPVIEAVPKKLVVYDTMLLDQPRTFKVYWESNVTDRVFVTAGESTGATIKEIEDYLVNAGFSHSPRLVGGALSCMINTMIKEGYAEIKEDIDNPGFYYDPHKDRITAVKKNVSAPKKSELLQGVEVLESLKHFFQDNTETLTTVFKWGCMSAFSYAMKQAGKWMPWMYLKGSAGSGKTTLAKIILYIWGEPTAENNVGGSSFDTVARMGAKLSRSCDPIVVNEPAAVFNRSSTNEMIKVSVESTTARSRYTRSYYGSIPAFSPVLFTANQYLPEDDALLRRLYVLSFSYSQRKTEHQKKMFEDTFHINTPTISPLTKLDVFGKFTANHIMSDPGLLLDDWKETIDNIINKLFESVEMETPEWLTKWAESESLEDFDDSQREDIRRFFIQSFNQARKKVQVYNENGYSTDATLDIEEVATGLDFEDINWNIINNRLLEWAMPHISRNNTRYICFTQSLRKSISESIDFCSDLKSIGELLGWEYKPVKFNGKVMKVIKVKFDDFMEFLYPNIVFEEDEI